MTHRDFIICLKPPAVHVCVLAGAEARARSLEIEFDNAVELAMTVANAAGDTGNDIADQLAGGGEVR
jgi:hypothetical protein